MKIKLLSILLSITYLAFVSAQDQPTFTPADQRLTGVEVRKKLHQNSLINHIPFRSIGPTVMSGRVSDLEVSPTDPSHFYVGYASGGLWKTTSNGATFTPLFDNEAVMTIGDIAVNWEEGIIWVGTGENNSSRSSYSGVGMYKSTDDGETWQHMGLPESHHIGRIILHPTNPDIVWVGVLGHLYSPNPERGVYKTTDGGKTWKKTLFVHDNAGVIDLLIAPNDANILYAATWERQRRAWNFWEGGKGSGIYKSTDGGENWTLLTTEKSGFPIGEGVGRIGLDIHKNGWIYAVLDNQFRRKKDKKKEKTGLTKDDLRTMSKADFLKLDKTKISKFLRENRFPKKYGIREVLTMIQTDKIKPNALVEFLEDANSLLFNTPVIGAEVYVSKDGGKSWKKTHQDHLDNVYNSYGYYFGQIRVAGYNPNKIYIMGVPILTSDDGGKTWTSIGKENVHVDHHALWLNPTRKGHLINGNDGGVNISYDDGAHWFKCNVPPLGQFYAIAIDMARPYKVYGGLQDNGVWFGPSTYQNNKRWHSTGHYPYREILGGDGMQVAVDTRDNATVYTGFQFGNYYRIHTKSNESKSIKPRHELGERPLRFNWQTPIHLSSHNQDILYLGSNKLHRSLNQGNHFDAISDDLTKGGKKGDVAFGTLTTISESPLKFGLLYVGTDDGLIHITKDGGNSWTKISDKLPQNRWVTKVWASPHDEATVYAALNGYRWDDFTAYVYVSTDYGQHWTAIGTDLPAEPVNVIKDDPQNANIVYVGTDHGLYVSLDKGKTFMAMSKNLPATAVHDLIVHPRDKELIVGTHGRSLYVANATHLQQLDNDLLVKSLHIFDIPKMKYRANWGHRYSQWSKAFEPKITIPIFAQQSGKATMIIKTTKGLVLQKVTTNIGKGINYMAYDLTILSSAVKDFEKALRKATDEDIEIKKARNGQYYLYKGEYTIEVEVNGEKAEQVLEVFD